MKQDFKSKLIEFAPVIGLTLLAGAFRFPALGVAPPGLYHDEAYNGLDALGVLNGNLQIYFPANHGREPIYIYLVAISIGIFGATPFAVRLPAAIAGTLTILATYWMARQLWGRRIGLLAAAIMAVTLWPIHLSRIGFRAVLLPLFAAPGIGLTVRAWRSGRRRDWLLAGALWGLSFYTYLAIRFVPLAFVLLAVFLLLFRRIEAGPFLPQRLSNGALWATVGLALLLAPLAIYTLGNWEAVMGRPGGVSVFEPGINRGDLPGALAGNALEAMGMFFWQGDRIPRHNTPWRPVFDPLLAFAFAIGLVSMIRQARHRIAAVFALVWVSVMLLPTILSEDTPHFLRAAGVLPMAAVFPALGLDWVVARIGNHRDTENTGNKLRALRASVVILILALSAWWTVRDYVPYASNAETGYAFEAGAVELANEANRLSASGRRILMDEVYLREWTSISFTLKQPPDVTFDDETPLPDQPVAPVLLVAWPYGDWTSRLSAWPRPAQVRVRAGPLAKGDRDPQPYTMTVLVEIEPGTIGAGAAQASFENAVRLLGYAIEDRGDEWRLRTLWQAEKRIGDDVTMFVHLLNAGSLVTTADGDPGDGLYPIRLWRPGDVVVDERRILLPAGAERSQMSVAIGLYDRQTNLRLSISETNGPIVENALQLGAPGGPGP